MSDHSPTAHAGHPGATEPTTPMWLPALGAALLVIAALAWVMSPSEPAPAAATTVSGAPAATATAARPAMR